MSPDARSAARLKSLASRLKLRHMTLLRALGEQLVLSRVADRLGLTQPAVTKALREIEDIFMTPLFERVGRGLRPTASGTVVLRYVSLALADLEAISRTLTALDSGLVGRVRIGILSDAPTSLVSAMLGHFRKHAGRISLSIREGNTTELTQALAERSLDCVLARAHHLHIDGVEQRTILRQEPCLLVAAASWRRLASRRIDLTALAKMDWIMQPLGSTGRATVDGIFVAAGVPPPNPFMETHSIRSIEDALRHEPNAVCILSRDVSQELLDCGACGILPMRLDWTLPPLTLFTAKDSGAHELMIGLDAALLGPSGADHRATNAR